MRGRRYSTDDSGGDRCRCEHCDTLTALVAASADAALIVDAHPDAAPGAVRLDRRLGFVIDLVRLLHEGRQEQ